MKVSLPSIHAAFYAAQSRGEKPQASVFNFQNKTKLLLNEGQQ